MRILLLLVLTMVSCKEKTIQEKQVENHIKSEYSIKCVDVGSLRRCENQEVVCYYNTYIESMTLQCKFKGENNARN